MEKRKKSPIVLSKNTFSSPKKDRFHHSVNFGQFEAGYSAVQHPSNVDVATRKAAAKRAELEHLL